MATGNKKTATPKVAKNTDEMVKELFQKVQAKKNAIEKAEKPVWNAGSFGYSTSSAHDRTDVKIVSDVRKLIEMYAFLIERESNYIIAATELGADNKFTWLGFTADEWKSDFKTRSMQLNIQKERKTLQELEVRLNGLISPELKAQMELEAISALLAD